MTSIPIRPDDSPTVVVELIYSLKVRDVMSKELITATRDESLRGIQEKMKANGITGIPIVSGRRILGIVSIDDIVNALDGGHIDEAAENWMTRSLIVLEDDMPLAFGISYLEKYKYGRFPVLNRNKELVGIVTSRDVLVSLLVAVNKELERLEAAQAPPPESPDGEVRRVYRTRRFDFEAAGKASAEIKAILKDRGLDSKTIRRVAVACYELEMNQVVHSYGGTLDIRISPEQVVLEAVDPGPGIANVDQALTEGWSTANDWIRSLGFGAGMGLPNTHRVSDEFDIDSAVGTGTKVRIAIRLGNKEER